MALTFSTTCAVPANTWAQGVDYVIHAQFAVWTSSSAASLTYFRLIYNGGTIAAGATTPGNSRAGVSQVAEWRVKGLSTTTFMPSIDFIQFAGETQGQQFTPSPPIQTVTTSAASFAIMVEWSAGTAANGIQLLSFTVSRVN